jgi:hypothetical protein
MEADDLLRSYNASDCFLWLNNQTNEINQKNQINETG